MEHILNGKEAHYFAAVKWLKHSEDETYLDPMKCWSTDYDMGSVYRFLPVSRIVSRATFIVLNEEKILVFKFQQKLCY